MKCYNTTQQVTQHNEDKKMSEQNTTEQNIQNNARRVVILYKILEDNINKGSLVGIAIWSDALLNCIAHIEVDNKYLFGL